MRNLAGGHLKSVQGRLALNGRPIDNGKRAEAQLACRKQGSEPGGAEAEAVVRLYIWCDGIKVIGFD